MQTLPYPRLTPWVTRLAIANAVVLLLRLTLFTSDAITRVLAFTPGELLAQPWTPVTYLFVHADLVHLLLNTLGLVVFGSPLESRMGGRGFLALYFFAGIGAALFTMALSALYPVNPFIGASGAVLGLVVAYAMTWPDAELMVFPLPMALRAPTVAVALVALNVVLAFASRGGGVAYEAHVGGAIMGYLFIRLQRLGQPGAPAPRAIEPVIPPTVPAAAVERSRAKPAPPVAARTSRALDRAAMAAEMDRVLDKISATGMDSLTPQERRFLDEVSRRKQAGPDA